MLACYGGGLAGNSLALNHHAKIAAKNNVKRPTFFPNQLKPFKPHQTLFRTRALPPFLAVSVAETAGNRLNFVDHGLGEADLEVWAIVDKEKQRQFRSLELIASENFTYGVVMETVGSCLTNKYSEGLLGKR